MPSNWENIKKTVNDELSDAAAATRKYFKIGKGRVDLMTMKHSLNDAFRDLGIEVYSQIDEEKDGDIRDNVKVKSLIERVGQLKQSIHDRELELEKIKKQSVPQDESGEDKNNHPPDVRAEKTV